MNLQKVNNSIYVIPKIGSGKDDKWKGKKLLDVRYWVMSILAKRRSGKTTLIFNLIKNFCTKKTIVIFFVPTFQKDDTYKAIRDYLDEKGNQYLHFGSIKEDGVDNITTFMEANKGENSDGEEKGEDSERPQGVKKPLEAPTCNFGDTPEVGKEKKKKEPTPPEYLIIFDDISSELRDKSVSVLCKNSRHFKCKIILSSQSIIDLNPNTHAQVDYCCLFKDFNEDSLEKIYRKLEPNLDYESFKELYRSVTETKMKGHPHLNNFLLIDRARQEYRVNLSHRVDVKLLT
jgi:hypothetical protein